MVTKPPRRAAFLAGEEQVVPCRDKVCGLYAQPVEEGDDRQLDDLRYGTGSVDHAQQAPSAYIFDRHAAVSSDHDAP